MKLFYVSIGITPHGPTGVLMDVWATSKEHALAVILEHFQEEHIWEEAFIVPGDQPGVSNVKCFMNPEAVTLEDIVDTRKPCIDQ